MEAESIAIGGMLSQLNELEAPPIEFDEKLCHAVVDRVTVYNDYRLVYSLKDGSEITVMLLERIEKIPQRHQDVMLFGDFPIKLKNANFRFQEASVKSHIEGHPLSNQC